MSQPQRYGLLGWPLAGSLSAAMHNAAFAALGIAATYEDRPTPPERLADALAALRQGELAGVNVTVPHKVAIRPLLDDEDDVATAIGAVNTVISNGSGLLGHNTDAAGFMAALEELGLAGTGLGRQAVVLGSGGAARAVVHVLASNGWSVRILSRSSGQSAVVAASASRQHPGAVLSTGRLYPDDLVAAAKEAELLVNATPVGGVNSPTDSLWPSKTPLPSRLTVLDLVAFPAVTPLVTAARDDGCTAAGGQAMLLGQAAAAFQLWTGQPAPVQVMRAALDQALATGGSEALP
jgi:shikimate dehydrogenase